MCHTGHRELKLSEQDSDALGLVLWKNNDGRSVQTGGREITDKNDKLGDSSNSSQERIVLKRENERTNGMETCKRGRKGTRNRFNAGSVLIAVL